jgi:predicted CopG family antitoxin
MSKHVRLDERIYERIQSEKRDDESFSDAVERLIGQRSFRELGEVFSDRQVAEMRRAIEAADEADRHAVGELADRFE